MGILLHGAVVVAHLTVLVPAEVIEWLERRAIGLGLALHRVAVEGIGDRLARHAESKVFL
jgi:hypothetical protein